MQEVEIETYKHHGIWISGDEYNIFWFRGKEYFSYDATEELVEKSRKSDKDALEVMFYLEHKRWPEEGELENYNKTDIKTYVGDGFLIYEENGEYEIEIERDWGKAQRYPINKELKEKALKSSRDGYEVAIYAETGRWPLKDQDEVDREFLRKYPEFILKNPEFNKKLFSEEEYEHLVKLAKEEQEKEKIAEREKEEIRGNPELISWVSEKKRNLFSKEEIERLEVLAKENKKIHKKKIRKRWGKIIVASAVVLIFLSGGLYGYFKISNKNAFQEMYNSYYHLSPYKSVEYMPQLNEHYRPTKTLWDTLTHLYSNKASLTYKGFKKSITLVEDGQIVLEKYIPISEDASIEIYYSYDIKAYKLTNYVIAKEGSKEVPVEDFLEKYNISKGYIKAVSDKLLDSVLTDWKNFSGSPYSKDNMGTITIEKDEILK
ncbi:TipC family immunity protein [Gemella sanguinis]|uniref:TipC family immunity protein n=1 Tax=Gemella sanguinis TaxID=84135 RepID=UPI000AD3575E|nr:TipC family immunity protein [Gemella sanguinis]NKZ26504.1 TipC family immunity protein [Gemella sanguinis]